VHATELVPLAALFAVGLASGALNVVAGGGSFLTVPVLLFYGMPGTEANATNRVGVLAQNLGGVWGFHRSGTMRWRWALMVSVPALVGAAIGALLALRLGDLGFRRLLAVAMLAATLFTVRRRPPEARTALVPASHPGMLATFFAIGVYGGLINAGIGFAILAATSLAGLDLVKGNAVKVLTVLLLTALSLVIFAANGVVRWGPGVALAFGNALGALAGVRLTLAQGHAWIERVVTAAVVLFAVLLLLGV
jgi:uncharacterized membrane protein YfcA